jgi:hypothetical protein
LFSSYAGSNLLSGPQTALGVKILASEQAQRWLRHLPPDAKQRVRSALRKLAKDRGGNIKALEAELEGFARHIAHLHAVDADLLRSGLGDVQGIVGLAQELAAIEAPLLLEGRQAGGHHTNEARHSRRRRLSFG